MFPQGKKYQFNLSCFCSHPEHTGTHPSASGCVFVYSALPVSVKSHYRPCTVFNSSAKPSLNCVARDQHSHLCLVMINFHHTFSYTAFYSMTRDTIFSHSFPPLHCPRYHTPIKRHQPSPGGKGWRLTLALPSSAGFRCAFCYLPDCERGPSELREPLEEEDSSHPTRYHPLSPAFHLRPRLGQSLPHVSIPELHAILHPRGAPAHRKPVLPGRLWDRATADRAPPPRPVPRCCNTESLRRPQPARDCRVRRSAAQRLFLRVRPLERGGRAGSGSARARRAGYSL